jgi:photosystem II stability/assembly factor-like uncharacterized protein
MRLLTFLLLIIVQQAFSQQPTVQTTRLTRPASLRGLSVVDDNVAWVSGDHGCIAISTDGGNSWKQMQVAGFEKYDFRSIYAFNAKTAIIANAGTPAHILLTTDGGATWNVVYKNNDSAAFFDGIDFWNSNEGIIYGDPIKGRMLLLRTTDAGKTWKELPAEITPALETGEASFAASGTAIRCIGNSKVVIATGGTVSRLWVSGNKGDTWDHLSTPILQGDATTGIFSVAFTDEHHAIIVGGDYKEQQLQVNHVFITEDGGYTWVPPFTPTGGYRECIEYIGKNTAVAVGPAGADITRDGGKKWEKFPADGFHVIRKSRKGSLVLLAGVEGKIAVLKLNTKH